MFFMLLMSPIWFICDLLIGLIPAPVFQSVLGTGFLGLLGFGVRVMGVGNFMAIMTSVVFWTGLQFVWALIEWVYNKAPGVN